MKSVTINVPRNQFQDDLIDLTEAIGFDPRTVYQDNLQVVFCFMAAGLMIENGISPDKYDGMVMWNETIRCWSVVCTPINASSFT